MAQKHPLDALVSLALGIAEYRLGNYEAATGPLEISENRGRRFFHTAPIARHGLVQTLVFQAMNAHQTGDAEESEKRLSEAKSYLEELDDKILWYERVFIRKAIEEAEKLSAKEDPNL